MSGVTLAVPAPVAVDLRWHADARAEGPAGAGCSPAAAAYSAKSAADGAKPATANATDAAMSHLFDTIPARPPDPDP